MKLSQDTIVSSRTIVDDDLDRRGRQRRDATGPEVPIWSFREDLCAGLERKDRRKILDEK